MMSGKGTIALMGSGELTATMVEVHKELLAKLRPTPHAVFLDTPAGFQLNVDQLSHKAVAYFHDRIQHSMEVVSFKDKDTLSPYQAEQAFHALRGANFVLIGPGSPTYAVRNWQLTPIPELLTRIVGSGGCLVAASAAALTLGRFTLPVYEIYKVGQILHWMEGLDVLAHFGFPLVVIPHWNNAEGGSHDTRFCYMGEARFRKLQTLLPEDVSIFGLDEHTACLLDFEADEAFVKGLGRATLWRRGTELTFERGERFPLDLLRGGEVSRPWGMPGAPQAAPIGPAEEAEASLWKAVHSLEAAFQVSIQEHDAKAAVNSLLELDRRLWQARRDGENEEDLAQARELFRELLVLLGMEREAGSEDRGLGLSPLVEELVNLREHLRQSRQWVEADALREILHRAGVVIEDTKEGPRWQISA